MIAMNNIYPPSKNHLFSKEAMIKAIQDLYTFVNQYVEKDTSYKPYNPNWRTTGTLAQLCQDIVSDEEAVVGNSFTGQVSCSGLPKGMSNGELKVDVTQGLNGKLLVLTMTSTNLEPYHWEQTYYNGNFSGWKEWLIPVDEDALFANTVSTDQKKQAALMQVLMLEQMYGYTSETVQNPEYTHVIVDSEDKIIAGKKVDGSIELFGVTYND